jgi:hypothetical protein
MLIFNIKPKKYNMEDDKICENIEKCPIYSGILKSNSTLSSTYKNLFCLNGPEGKNSCRRYQVSKTIGTCPPNILPNSQMSVIEIINKMKTEKTKF